MKYIYKVKYLLFFIVSLASFSSCNIEDFPNPNGVELGEVLDDPTVGELQTLVTGTEAALREEIGFYYDLVSIIGREYYFFTASDPRFTGEILGRGESMLDNAGFYGTRPYAGRYRTIRNLNVLIQSAQNSSFLTDSELQGYLGFARTLQAFELHIVANLQFQNGIRVDVEDEDNLGPFVTYDEALVEILALLDLAMTNLDAADTFRFTLSSGFTSADETQIDFTSPATFGMFNRALSARIALYQGNNADAISRINGSFFNPMAPLDLGPSRFYSLAGGDLTNEVFRPLEQSDAIIAHPSFLDDAEPGDNRLSRVVERSAPLSLDDLSGTHDVFVFESQESPIPLINNEELGLILAEANIGIDNGTTVNLLNWIRGNAGLPDYNGGTTDAELLDELLTQRRYSLYGLGHRWVDLRRYDRLSELPIDRPDDDVWIQIPRPVTEPQ